MKAREGENRRDALARLRALYQKAPIMLHSIDAAGRLLSVNELWLETMGYASRDVLGEFFGAFLDAGSRSDFEAVLPSFQTARRFTDLPFRMVTRQGRVLDVLVSAVSVFDQEGRFESSLAAVLDVTERRRTEQALAASEELFRVAFEGANEGLCIVGTDGRFLRVNDAVCQFFGLEQDRLLELTVNDLACPEDACLSAEHIAKALSGQREQFLFEKRYLHATGRRIWGRISSRLARDAKGDPLYFISHLLDVTEAKRAAEERALHTKTLESLLNLGRMREASLADLGGYALSQAVTLTGSASGLCALYDATRGSLELLAADPLALCAFGLPEEATRCDLAALGIDTPWDALVPIVGNTPEVGLASLAGCSGTGRPLRHLVVPVSAGGEAGLLLSVIDKDEPYPATDVGRLSLLGEGVLGHVRNRQRERDLEHARKQAEAASQAKSGFLANMSHEIRTPLSGIIGLAQMTLGQSPRPDLREHLEMILDSSRSLLSIVNDILDFSKIEAGKMEFSPVDFDLRECLDRDMKPFQFSSRQKGLKLSVRIDPELPDILHGDPDRIMQVVRNLVGNAMKFTEQGEVAVTFRLLRQGDPMLVECAVRDTGIGIPEDRLPELFQVFSQLESTRTKRYGGTGLGLAISRRLVEMMGGTIDVKSQPGRGSVFSFTVSLRPAQESQREETRRGGDAPVGGFAGLRVLLAEDNQVNRLFLKHFLVEAGCEVLLAGSGGEVLALLENASVDLVLMDIQMPEMDGAEATHRIREGEAGEAARGLPIVALTAYSMKGDRERFLSVGLDDYVSKPVDVDELFMVMRRVLERPGAAGPRSREVRREPMDMAYYEARGKSEFAREICRLFLEESPAVAASLITAAEAGDWGRVADQAHTLLGMAVPLRARGLTEDARKLQEAALAGDACACRETSVKVLNVLGSVQGAIRDLLGDACNTAKGGAAGLTRPDR